MSETVSETLRANGFVHRPAALSSAQLEALRDATDTLRFTGGGAYGSICHNPWRSHACFLDIARELKLIDVAREAVGGAALLWFQDHIICKEPGGERAIAWHQDYSYWPLDCALGVTMWIALDDADRDSGCLSYVPGSHLEGEREPANFVGGAEGAQPSRAIRLPPLPVERADSEATDVDVVAGDWLLHDPLVWHRSGPNRGPRRRRAWSISWVARDARWDLAHAPHPYALERDVRDGATLEDRLFPRL